MKRKQEKNRIEWTPRAWFTGFLAIILASLVLIAALVAVLDPWFHYHAPLSAFFYTLSDQRSQNDGITKHFSYDAVITGTSMIENFKTSECDALFGTNAVKLPYPGATFREISENLETAFATHDEIRLIIRGLDYSHLVEDAAALRTDMGEYPDYLYDRNPFNDVRYFYNRSALVDFCVPMLARRLMGRPGGVTDFDDYGSTADDVYGAAQALEGRTAFAVTDPESRLETGLTEKESALVRDNVRLNVAALADAHPDTEFLCFFTPYSAVWYGSLLENGTFRKQLEAERITAQELLSCPNVRLYSFSTDSSITADLSHYKDAGHYSPEVSSELLRRMAAGEGEITADTLDAYLAEEENLYRTMDYEALIAGQTGG